MTKSKYLMVLILLVGLLVPWTQNTQAGMDFQSQDQPVVRVVMFWLSTCGHCEHVINEVLPPIQEQHGDQLEILLIELVTQEDVDRLYETAAIVMYVVVNDPDADIRGTAVFWLSQNDSDGPPRSP